MIKILLADDHKLMREGLRMLIEKTGRLTIVGEADNGVSAVRMARELKPDLVLMDIAMPGLNGLEATERMARDFPNVRIILLPMHNNDEYVLRALKSGASRTSSSPTVKSWSS